jgi:hypothetical protein
MPGGRDAAVGIRALLVLLTLTLGSAGVAAASTTHDLRGDWRVCGPDTPPGAPCSAADQLWHITAMDLSSGAFSGNGSGTPPNNLTFRITGTATGDQFEMDNPHDTIDYSPHWSGTIAADNNSMSGTWKESGSTGTWYAVRTSGPGGGGTPPPGGAGKRATVTRVSCNYFVATANDMCTATVGDVGAAPRKTPTGAVRFASANGGAFTSGNGCALTPTPSSPGVASCSVEFLPPSSTFPRVGAAYGGDADHNPSTGATTFYILGSSVTDFGVNLGAEPTLGTNTTGPFTATCPRQRAGLRANAARFGEIVQCTADITAGVDAFDNPTLAQPCRRALNTSRDVGSCTPAIRDAFNARNQEIDRETQVLSQMIARRQALFDKLRVIIDQYNRTAGEVIHSMGRSVPRVRSARSRRLALGRVHLVLRPGSQRSARIALTPAARAMLRFPRRIRALLPTFALPVKVRLRLVAVNPQRGSSRRDARPRRRTIDRRVAFAIGPG